MNSKVAMFGLCYILSIFVFLIIGEFGIAIMAAFILFVGLRVCGH